MPSPVWAASTPDTASTMGLFGIGLGLLGMAWSPFPQVIASNLADISIAKGRAKNPALLLFPIAFKRSASAKEAQSRWQNPPGAA